LAVHDREHDASGTVIGIDGRCLVIWKFGGVHKLGAEFSSEPKTRLFCGRRDDLNCRGNDFGRGVGIDFIANYGAIVVIGEVDTRAFVRATAVRWDARILDEERERDGTTNVEFVFEASL